jgi:phenylalanine-4-hydroxylase
MVIVYREYADSLVVLGRSARSRWSLLPPDAGGGVLGGTAATVRERETIAMFEEAQLYSPVTQGDDGRVEVHLGEDHPGFNDPVYRERRNEIAAAAMAWTPGEDVPQIAYADIENDIWRKVSRELHVKHERYACREFLEAKAALGLPEDRVPQLDEVTAQLKPLTGFEYHPAPGLVALREFYGSLGDRVFHSTQYVRHPSEPLYTPEPDVIHEVIGHGNLLASPRFAAIKREAGLAAQRVETDEALQVIADVFWFTMEFGVLHEDGELRAYGAGILSSYGEIEEFRRMEIRPLDFAEMVTIDYDITKYQPVLYAADSMGQLEDAVGGFFREAGDDTPARLGAVSSARG